MLRQTVGSWVAAVQVRCVPRGSGVEMLSVPWWFSARRRILARPLDRLGIPVTPVLADASLRRLGHNNVALTLAPYGELFEDGSDEAVDRLEALLGGAHPVSADVVKLRRKEEV